MIRYSTRGNFLRRSVMNPNSRQVLGGGVGENEGKCVGDFVGNFVGEDEEDDLSTCAKVGFFCRKGRWRSLSWIGSRWSLCGIWSWRCNSWVKCCWTLSWM